MDAEKLLSVVLVALPDDRLPSESEIADTVERVCSTFGAGADVRAEVLRKAQVRLLIRMDTGFALVEDHKPWVAARKAQIDPFYWERFKLWLQRQKWPAGVIRGLDGSTEDILDLLGNPDEENTWKRRGLVLGDVQSGKTATYSALICKAADAGYRFVVLLTGTIENLRRQTQERLDAGFVGFDSSEHLKRNRREILVGVGQLNPRRQATVFTSSVADFRVQTADALGLSLHALREPALVVIKKHTKILENLSLWVERYTGAGGQGAIDLPMLLIDDEADNASINTNDPGADPTAVNRGIRALLKLFRRTTYVGFTATPFANIFVNPDTTEEMLGDDLFPRDFIYTLEAPTNYFGPRKIFLDDSSSDAHLRTIGDMETVIPTRHKSDLQVGGLPDSLMVALRSFLVANAIRDLRQEGATHRSMLVNVSQFTKVQDQVEQLLHDELARIQTSIRNFSALAPDEALTDFHIRSLHDAWQAEYAGSGFSWAEVQRALHAATAPVTTIAVNQRTGPRALDYRAHKDVGLRVVAVGGNSLSRGLTLEGLSTSYFRRNTQLYDTLLQMGRWFGYRPGYEDLCRVWLPSAAIDWYGHITEATDELRAELQKMFRMKRTPKDFGLAVRAHPDSLMVTARNKMRTAQTVTRVISVSEQSFESVDLPDSRPALHENWETAARFVENIRGKGVPASGLFRRGVPRKDVADLLRAFRVPAAELRFQPDAIATLLDSLPVDVLDRWDVALPTGSGVTESLGGEAVRSQLRMVRREKDVSLTVSGEKRRVGSRGVEKAGLDDEQQERAVAAALLAARDRAEKEGTEVPTSVNVADRFYRAERTFPLLLIHVLTLKPERDTDSRNGEPPCDLSHLGESPRAVALGLSFPRIEGAPAWKEVTYKVNVVRAKELFGNGAEAGDDEDEPVDLE
jgi:hypothetical protein